MDPALLCNRPMQSSSTLFPVALLSAERRGDLSEDVYRIKAGNSPDPSVELAVTRLGLADQAVAQGVPVILLHGSFSNRRFWYSPKGVGLGAFLARAGFDVWIPEMRGHGLSPRNRHWRHNRVADYARFDLPVIGAFIESRPARRRTGSATPGWHHPRRSPGRRIFGSRAGGQRGVLRYPGQSGLLAVEGSACGLERAFAAQAPRSAVRVAAQTWAGGRADRSGLGDPGLARPVRALRRQAGRLVGGAGDRERAGAGSGRCGRLPDPVWACRKLFEQLGGQRKQFYGLALKKASTHSGMWTCWLARRPGAGMATGGALAEGP